MSSIYNSANKLTPKRSMFHDDKWPLTWRKNKQKPKIAEIARLEINKKLTGLVSLFMVLLKLASNNATVKAVANGNRGINHERFKSLVIQIPLESF